MKFYCQPVVAIAPDTNEEQTILRPLVPLIILGSTEAACCAALVDSGADNTILPKAVADYLGIAIEPCPGPSPIAIGGNQLAMLYGEADLQLTDGNNSASWRCRVLFHDGEDEVALLGHRGFLEFLTAIFDGQDGMLQLEPNDTLP